MEDKYSLEGKLVSMFLRGGWDFTGRVEYASKDKVVLVSDMGSLVIYKENIVAAMVIDEKKAKEPIEPKKPTPYDSRVADPRLKAPRFFARMPELEEGSFDDYEQQSLYGAVIPEDMLEGDSEDQFPVSFSISLADLKSVKIKEDEDGSTEKTPEHRRKDKA